MGFGFPTLSSSLYRDLMELSSLLNYLTPSLPIIIVLAWYTLALSPLSFFVNLLTTISLFSFSYLWPNN